MSIYNTHASPTAYKGPYDDDLDLCVSKKLFFQNIVVIPTKPKPAEVLPSNPTTIPVQSAAINIEKPVSDSKILLPIV